MLQDKEQNKEPKEPSEIVWKIVRARVSSMSPNLRLSIGGFGTMNKNQLIAHIDKKDEVGKILLRAHMNYLKSFKQEANQVFG